MSPVQAGHVYIVGIAVVAEPGLDVQKGGTLYVKLRLVDYSPGRYVRLIWDTLDAN